MKILFHSRAGNHQPGDKIYLKGYKRPFKVLKPNNKNTSGDTTVRVQHVITKAIMYLSPGWPCLYDNPEMKETLGLT